MSDEDFIDSSEPWGVVTDHVDWFVAKSFEETKLFRKNIFQSHLYIFTVNTFKHQRWVGKQFRSFEDYQQMVESALENSSINTYRKADITAFRTESFRIKIAGEDESRFHVCFDYGNKWFTCFQAGLGYMRSNNPAPDNNHYTSVHSRLLRGFNRQLLPLPGDKEGQEAYQKNQLLLGGVVMSNVLL